MFRFNKVVNHQNQGTDEYPNALGINQVMPKRLKHECQDDGNNRIEYNRI